MFSEMPVSHNASTVLNKASTDPETMARFYALQQRSPEDAAARRAAEVADAELKRKMTFGVFLFALPVTAVVFGGCVYVFANGPSGDEKWAAAIVSAIASGLVGFLVGQGKK